jgi:hypothetical protein
MIEVFVYDFCRIVCLVMIVTCKWSTSKAPLHRARLSLVLLLVAVIESYKVSKYDETFTKTKSIIYVFKDL